MLQYTPEQLFTSDELRSFEVMSSHTHPDMVEESSNYLARLHQSHSLNAFELINTNTPKRERISRYVFAAGLLATSLYELHRGELVTPLPLAFVSARLLGRIRNVDSSVHTQKASIIFSYMQRLETGNAEG